MEIYQRVVTHFQDSIDSTMSCIDTLPAAITEAGELLVQCLLSDNKIITAGEAQSGLLAQHLTLNLINRFNHERPGLPSINLNSDGTTLSAIASDSNPQELFAKQINALGQPGDVLVIFASCGNCRATLKAIQAAHSRDMRVVALCSSSDCGDIQSLLAMEDCDLTCDDSYTPRAIELQLLTIHCLCDLIDRQLFGCED